VIDPLKTMGSKLTPHARQSTRIKLTLAAVAIVLLLLVGRCITGPERIPDFSSIENVADKKAAFFGFLEPHITAVNRAVLQQRAELIDIRAEVAEDGKAGWLDRRRLKQLALEYKMDVPEEFDLRFLDRLLQRVDSIPPSLIMAQAANESAWGTSRFARLGNNLFGMRTYEPGTGIVPKRRPADATWEVATYHSVRGSIKAYVHNLNTNAAYRQLRTIRRDLRQNKRTLSGSSLAGGLARYSERGYEYVSIIRSIIRSNQLARYDSALDDGN